MTSSGAEATDRLILDTSGYSQLRAGHTGAFEWIASATTVVVPVIVLGELDAAFRRGSRAVMNSQSLDEFLAEPFVDVAQVDRTVARRYGLIVDELRRRDTPISINDVWIAAITLALGGRLLTFDRDFQPVPGLDCRVLAP